jgi:mono/diheme cytochrome c family protein
MKVPSIVALVLSGVALYSPARADTPGEALFAERCAMCHRTNGMGVGILSRRPGDTSKGLLEARQDLTAPLITTVARIGIGNMPRISRGEVSDPELKLIADYLAKGKP